MKLYHQKTPPFQLPENREKTAEEIIKDFVIENHLHEIKEDLWALVETALITNNTRFNKSYQRDNILFFYKQMERLMEAVYTINS
ncbi:MAG: hypothetical protein IT249_19245 [Chitinophagaceae bacterium]|nr:hypothetical protein [Chitinophagaceae bacterium]